MMHRRLYPVLDSLGLPRPPAWSIAALDTIRPDPDRAFYLRWHSTVVNKPRLVSYRWITKNRRALTAEEDMGRLLQVDEVVYAVAGGCLLNGDLTLVEVVRGHLSQLLTDGVLAARFVSSGDGLVRLAGGNQEGVDYLPNTPREVVAGAAIARTILMLADRVPVDGLVEVLIDHRGSPYVVDLKIWPYRPVVSNLVTLRPDSVLIEGTVGTPYAGPFDLELLDRCGGPGSIALGSRALLCHFVTRAVARYGTGIVV